MIARLRAKSQEFDSERERLGMLLKENDILKNELYHKNELIDKLQSHLQSSKDDLPTFTI